MAQPGTLGDPVPATGAALHRAVQADTGRGGPAQPWQRHAAALAGQVTGWRQVRAALTPLRTPTPAWLSVRADIHAVRDLLIALTDPATANPQMRTLPVLLAGTRTLPDLAAFNAATLDRIATSGDLYVTSAALPRDLLSESRTLAEVTLHQALVKAPPTLVEPAKDAYSELLQQQPEHGPLAVAGLAPTSSPHRAERPARSRKGR